MVPPLRGENRTVENYFVVGFFFYEKERNYSKDNR